MKDFILKISTDSARTIGLNETILLGDVAGGDSFEDGINKCIAKNAIVNLNNTGLPVFL